MITREAMTTIVALVGQYIVDHADELIMTEYSDLTGDEISMRIIRRKDWYNAEENESKTHLL